ncbi:hypothetical protein ADL00_28500 [Streptomyces sp. AS58]|nr:hypothetical protein ADL00_28500 [Streptomyces sp. AS58]
MGGGSASGSVTGGSPGSPRAGAREAAERPSLASTSPAPGPRPAVPGGLDVSGLSTVTDGPAVERPTVPNGLRRRRRHLCRHLSGSNNPPAATRHTTTTPVSTPGAVSRAYAAVAQAAKAGGTRRRSAGSSCLG